jgi:uncharacterized short protein YbdD (DUF466 family)
MKWAVTFIVLLLTTVGIILTVLDMIPMVDYKVYDCSMSEFHPDFPTDVREECRKIRSNKKYITV